MLSFLCWFLIFDLALAALGDPYNWRVYEQSMQRGVLLFMFGMYSMHSCVGFLFTCPSGQVAPGAAL
jgi:hypothetical protein